MSEAPVARKAIPQAQSIGSGHTQVTSRQPYISQPIASKHVCFYKSGDPQFGGLPVVINHRTFKTFEALLDSLSKRVPLPFGVRTITTPHGHTAVRSLDQLQNGHSYICSDRRTVKPIDLERARRKLPPWYHASPVNVRRSGWHPGGTRQPGTRRARLNEHSSVLNTPKRLMVFRNGDPEVNHTLTLQRRTAHTFESLLNYMSEVMRFPVLRLYTPDGRRVDGLPALILSSGILVAAGREPFKRKNYDVQKYSSPTWLRTKRMIRRRPIARNGRKMKTGSIKSRPFSPSSEHYFVNQIHNSINGSMCELPSNQTDSLEMESGKHLESVAETETMTCVDGAREGDISLPPDDDIEKSFRVNQDGTMTVEMKVRLTIKEEETIHWTTTVSRSSVPNPLNSDFELCPNMNSYLPISLLEEDATETNKNTNCYSEKKTNTGEPHTEAEWPLSPLNHNHELGTVQQASTENTTTVNDNEMNENILYSSAEKYENSEIKQDHCIQRPCNPPVPKPRGTLLSETNGVTSTQVRSSRYRASEILQLQDDQKEVCETVVRIYEEQTSSEKYAGNAHLVVQSFGSSPFDSRHGYTASSETVFPASSEKTYNSSTENMESLKHLESTGKGTTLKPFISPYKKSMVVLSPQTTTKRRPVRVIVKKNYLLKTATKGRKQVKNGADILKEIKKIRADIYRQKGAMKLKEHFKPQRLKKRNAVNQDKYKDKSQIDHEKEQSNVQESFIIAEKNRLHASSSKTILTRQTSMHKENGSRGENHELGQSLPFPALHSSTSLVNEYVELWLQKSQPESTLRMDEQPLCTTKLPKVTAPIGSRKHLTEIPSLTIESKKTETNKNSNSHGLLDSERACPKDPQKTPSKNNTDDTTSDFHNTALPSQPSLETIPKNNTMLKASLFNNQSAMKTPMTSKETSPKNKSSEAKSPVVLNKNPVNSKDRNSRETSKDSELNIKTNSENVSMKRSPDVQILPSKEAADLQTQKFFTVKMAVSPDMKSVLDQLCYSIQSLSEIIRQRKKNKKLPDLSSHLPLIFGSSSRVLFVFLSVMTLKDGIRQLYAHNVSLHSQMLQNLSESMLMLQTLAKLAEIEDAEQMRSSLSRMYGSTSDQLRQTWKNFQKLSNDVWKKESNCNPQETNHAIQVLMEDLGVPERVRENLEVLINIDKQRKATDRKTNGHLELCPEKTDICSDFVLRDYVNVYVSSIINKAVDVHNKKSDNTEHSLEDNVNTPTRDMEITDQHQKDKNIYNIVGTLVGDSIPDSDICDDMPSSESSFEAEIFKTLQCKEKEQSGVLERNSIGRVENDIRKEGEMLEMRSETHKGMDEGRGTLDENSAEEENYRFHETELKIDVIEQVIQEVEYTVTEEDSDFSETLVTCEGKGLPSEEKNISYQDWVPSYLEENFPEECNNSRECPGTNDKAEDASIKENYSKDGQSQMSSKKNQDHTQKIVLHELQRHADDVQNESNVAFRIDEKEPLLPYDICGRQSASYPEEHVIVEQPECYTVYQESFVTIPEEEEEEIEDEENEIHVEKERTNNVANLINTLQERERSFDKRPYGTAQKSNKTLLKPSTEISKSSRTSKSRSTDPLSSALAFSYDSKNLLAKDPEEQIQINKVKSIKEMFLAKSHPHTQHTQTQMTSPVPDSSVCQNETDSRECRSIAKGYVKRTIERLYGKSPKGSNANEKRPPSSFKAKKRECLKGNISTLPSIHEAPMNLLSDLSYFNPTSSVIEFNEPGRCVALNTQLGPEDAVLIDKGRWLLRESQMSSQTSTDPEETSKNQTKKTEVVEAEQRSGNEEIPYSLFGHTSVTPDKDQDVSKKKEITGSPGTTFTYFHLPNAQELEPENVGHETELQKRPTENKVSPEIITEAPKCGPEKHSVLTVFTAVDAIKAGNKVHPITDPSSPVVTQPNKQAKPQREIARYSAEPDVLEMLYVFCGQHCPIL